MILIVGGAGYIGSHVNKYLCNKGYETIVFDNLSKGHKELVKWGKFIEGDLGNIEEVRKVFKENKIEAVMNFAAFIEVGESVIDPEKYYYNNVVNTLNLLKVMKENNVDKIIFSSTAATFGNPQYVPIDEKHPQSPINPYGMSKLMIENIFKDYEMAYGLKYVVFRYFNACGADVEAEIGEWHEPESHLIPLVFQAALGIREDIKIFGTDYETPDGTCIRDYVHVTDLAQVHWLGLERLLNGDCSGFFNLGNGKGFSVREVIESVKRVTGKDFKVTEVERREGDAAVLIAGSERARNVLEWKPEFTDLDEIVRTAWEWEKKKI
jgi:UDP-glucose 4-epimerase